MIGVAAEFLAGSVIPIPMMPESLQAALNFLPFRYTADLPFRIYSGNIGIPGRLSGIIIQMIWTGALLSVGTLLIGRMLRRTVIQGG